MSIEVHALLYVYLLVISCRLCYWVRDREMKTKDEKIAELQFKIDSLMLEYCPNDMTKEQIKNWEKHQKPAAYYKPYLPIELPKK